VPHGHHPVHRCAGGRAPAARRRGMSEPFSPLLTIIAVAGALTAMHPRSSRRRATRTSRSRRPSPCPAARPWAARRRCCPRTARWSSWRTGGFTSRPP
jgi:hypothetical protein